jgi:hypothetical protein
MLHEDTDLVGHGEECILFFQCVVFLVRYKVENVKLSL